MARGNQFSTIRDMEICLAIDISGSTVGAPLEAEIEAVRKFLDLRDDTSKKHLKMSLLPWTITPHHLIPLPEPVHKLLELLNPDSGTAPSCLYNSTEYVSALQKCNLWFLLTDGAVDEEELKAFTRATMQHGTHAKTCIVVLFGFENDYCQPGDLDVSTGISVFSLASDALYLFHDIPTGQVYILQAKGVFKTLLGTHPQAVFTVDLDWDMLPKTTYASLGTVHFPSTHKKRAVLDKDSIALERRLVVNPTNLYANQITPNLLDRVLTPTHLRSLSIIELSLGSADALSHWLSSHIKHPPEIPLMSFRPDIGHKAKASLQLILQYLQDGIQGDRMSHAQSSLRKAHEANWSRHRRTVIENYHEHITPTVQRNSLLLEAITNINTMRRAMDAYPKLGQPRNIFPARVAFPSQHPTNDHESFRAELATSWMPGYLLTPNTNLIGTCPFCDRERAQMALLFKVIAPTTFTPAGAGVRVPFKLNSSVRTDFPKLKRGIRDLISSTLCCDMCAYHINSRSPSQKTTGRIIAAIPCVGFAGRDDTEARNADSVFSVLDSVLWGSFRKGDVKQVWMTLVKDSEYESMEGDLALFGQALSWFYEELSDGLALESLRDRVRLGAMWAAAAATGGMGSLSEID